MRRAPTAEHAEIIGLQALAWLAGDADRLEKFMNACGIDGTSLRAVADQPETVAAVVDFLLSNEELLLAFCESASTSPETVIAARQHLAGAG
jgi:hypothetical protein